MSLTSVGKLLNKVIRISNGREKMRNISVSYRFQFRIMHFICSCNYFSLFFYHNMTRAQYIKAISQESKPRNSSDYKKNSKTTPNFASKMVDFTMHSRFH